jgi:hypothetical protein
MTEELTLGQRFFLQAMRLGLERNIYCLLFHIRLESLVRTAHQRCSNWTSCLPVIKEPSFTARKSPLVFQSRQLSRSTVETIKKHVQKMPRPPRKVEKSLL